MKKRCLDHAPPSMIINEISKLFNDQMRQKTEAFGMSDGSRRVLFHLSRNDQLTQLELARRTHLSSPAISVTLQKMESEGLVVRSNDPNDQRAVLVRLTEAGLAADRKVVAAIHETEDQLLNGITPDETETVRAILAKMYQNLAKEDPQ